MINYLDAEWIMKHVYGFFFREYLYILLYCTDNEALSCKTLMHCKNKKCYFNIITLLSQLRIHYALATHILKDLKDEHVYVSVTAVNQ